MYTEKTAFPERVEMVGYLLFSCLPENDLVTISWLKTCSLKNENSCIKSRTLATSITINNTCTGLVLQIMETNLM